MWMLRLALGTIQPISARVITTATLHLCQAIPSFAVNVFYMCTPWW